MNSNKVIPYLNQKVIVPKKVKFLTMEFYSLN